MSPLHSDHYAHVLLDDHRRDALALRTARPRSRWRARAGAALVRTGDGLRSLGRRVDAGAASPPTVAPDCC